MQSLPTVQHPFPKIAAMIPSILLALVAGLLTGILIAWYRQRQQ